MHTVRVALWPNERKDGTRPIVLRVTKNRKSSFKYLGIYVKPQDWDKDEKVVKESHPYAQEYNILIETKRHKLVQYILDLEIRNIELPTKEIIKRFEKGLQPDKYCFLECADAYLERLEKARKYNQFNADRPRIRHFKAFVKKEILPMEEVTVSFLLDFNTHLMQEVGLSERSAMNTLVVIRTIYNQAIRDNKVSKELYPFGRGKVVIRLNSESNKQGLDENEIAILERVKLSCPKEEHARRLFLWSFYNAGMRVSDVFRLRWEDIRDGRLHYKMGKNKKSGSIKLTSKAESILMHFKIEDPSPNGFIFPELRGLESEKDNFVIQKQIAQKLKIVNKYLKRIGNKLGFDKKVTMHVARHSFATISGDKIPIQLLQKLYRHSSVTTTLIYQQNFISTKTDEALEKVLGI